VPFAGGCIAGICCARLFSIPLEASAILVGLSLALLTLRTVWKVSATLLCFGLGLFIYSWRYEVLSPSELRLLLDDKESLVNVRGELLESPTVRETHYGEKVRANSSAAIRVTQIQSKNRWQPAEGVIATSTKQDLGTNFFPGQTVEVFGVIQLPAKAAAPGLFDFRSYLYNQRIFYVLRADSTNDWKIISSRDSPPLPERFRRWAKVQLARGLKEEDESLRLIWAMALGWQSTLSGEVSQPFMRTGTMHIFAISGLHVTCIAGLFLFAARMLGRPRHQCGFIVIPLLWFYVLATGWQSSAIRSAIMSSVIIAGWALKRPSALLNSTAAAALLILLFQPEQLFQTSFQLSFAVVASMALFIPVLEELRQKILAQDPFLPPELRPKWQKMIESPVAFLSVNFVVSLASWVGSLPIVAYYFNMITPVSLLANLAAVPLSSMSLVFTVLSLVIPPLGPIFNWISWAFMWATISVTKAFAIFPLAYFYVPKPNWEFFVFYFALLAALMSGSFWNPMRWRWAVSAVASLAVLWGFSAVSYTDCVQITMLPSAGTPLFVDFPGRANDMLIDCSTERDAEFVVKRFLHAQGVGSVQNVLLTHGDINHAQGFFELVPEFSPAKIFTGPAKARSPAFKNVIKTLEGMKGRWSLLSRGDWLGRWEVLHPVANHSFPRADDNCVVLRAEIEGWRVLFLGDLGSRGQDDLLRSEPDLRADIVVLGLPERDDPLKHETLDRLKPKLILLGTTRNPIARRSSKPVRSRPSGKSSLLFSTSDDGALTLKFKKGECSIETAGGKTLTLQHSD
jgi:competence protein ComEC